MYVLNVTSLDQLVTNKNKFISNKDIKIQNGYHYGR